MSIVEQMELIRNRNDIAADVMGLLEKYRSIFRSNLYGLDTSAADRLILQEIQQALKNIEKTLHS